MVATLGMAALSSAIDPELKVSGDIATYSDHIKMLVLGCFSVAVAVLNTAGSFLRNLTVVESACTLS